MAGPIPAKLKGLNIAPFAHRAAQLDKVKPIIAYWCNYWILHQILGHGLQSADAECTQYAMGLMDHVEQVKTEHATEDAILDDVAGQAYVEQFSLDTFQRGDNAMQANKVSKQTADTLQAAATFLELVNIWSSPSQEITSKIKYAKFHALRIVKAIKAGEDPNASNPPPPEPAAVSPEADIALDPNDPEVKLINNAATHQPSVADAPDDDADPGTVLPSVEASSPATHGPAAVSSPPPGIPDVPKEEIGSMAPSPSQPTTSGYFPPPTAPDPSAPTNADIEEFYGGGQSPQPPAAPSPVAPPPKSVTPAALPARSRAPVVPPPAAAPAAMPVASATIGGHPDDEAIAAAQKHARWAISALNFEDVTTAVNELRAALNRLGAA